MILRKVKVGNNMLYYILSALGWGLAAFTIWATEISPFWAIVLFPLFGFLVCLIELILFMAGGLLIKEGKTPQHVRPSYYRFMLFYSSHVIVKLLGVRIHVKGKDKLPKDKKKTKITTQWNIPTKMVNISSLINTKKSANTRFCTN